MYAIKSPSRGRSQIEVSWMTIESVAHAVADRMTCGGVMLLLLLCAVQGTSGDGLWPCPVRILAVKSCWQSG